MNHAHSSSPGLAAFEYKVAQLSSEIATLQAGLESELLGLLSPADLVALWRLRSPLDQTQALLNSRGWSHNRRVTEDMLDMVLQVEKILAFGVEQISKWRESRTTGQKP